LTASEIDQLFKHEIKNKELRDELDAALEEIQRHKQDHQNEVARL